MVGEIEADGRRPGNAEAVDRVYAILTGEDAEDRACEAIPGAACTDVPANYLLNVANGACTKMAEQLASPTLTLPWMLTAIGAPAALAALLAPLKQVGSLLPQLFVAGMIRARRIRKTVWVAAGSVQALCLAAMLAALLLLPGMAAGIAVVALFALFAIASGCGSVAFQDVTGKTIPKGRRGRLLASRAAIGGALTLVAAVLLRLVVSGEAGVGVFALLIGVAAGLWAAAALLFARIAELPGATEGGRNAWESVRQGLAIARANAAYRRYLGARSLLLSAEIGMPIVVVLAQQAAGGGLSSLALLVFAVGLANIVSSPLWGALSDSDSRRVMAYAGGLSTLAGLAALVIVFLAEGAGLIGWLFMPVFFALGVAESGARLGRKTYLVDGAPVAERPLVVAFANTAVGLVALAFGLLGLLADLTGPASAVVLLVVLAASGAGLAWTLPKPEGLVTRNGS
ncbi:MAG: MFS transporter [Azospirillaceae bacterium]